MEVSKGLLKAKMLEYFRKVEVTGEELIVTSHGKPTLKVIPIKEKKTVEQVFGDVRKKITLEGTVMEPETDEWDV